jgi:hypothetical protein
VTTKRIRESGKHRTVIARSPGKDISNEPKMKELKAVFGRMGDAEKARTINHLNTEEE